MAAAGRVPARPPEEEPAPVYTVPRADLQGPSGSAFSTLPDRLFRRTGQECAVTRIQPLSATLPVNLTHRPRSLRLLLMATESGLPQTEAARSPLRADSEVHGVTRPPSCPQTPRGTGISCPKQWSVSRERQCLLMRPLLFQALLHYRWMERVGWDIFKTYSRKRKSALPRSIPSTLGQYHHQGQMKTKYPRLTVLNKLCVLPEE